MPERLALTMIARGAAKTLGPCLDSVKEYVDPIVILLAGRPIDNTERVALEYTDHVYWWDNDILPDGGCSHFGQARQASLDKLAEITGPDCWWLWLDADDTVVDAAKLPLLVEQARTKQSGGVWLPYYYAFLADGTCTTLFERERVMYDPTNFLWRNRVHEIVTPRTPVHWTRSEQVAIRHNHLAGGNRSVRNLTLLRLMHEEDPNDKRVLFYLGHQHFANEEWAEAAAWYERYVDVADNKLEQWQAYLYLAKALRKIDRTDQALAASLIALGMAPEWRDSWFDVAESYAYKGEAERCLLFAELGHQREMAPRVVFTNPLDEIGWNVGLFVETCLFQEGKLDEALQKVKELQSITNTDFLKAKRIAYEEFVRTRDQAEAWLTVLDGQPATNVVGLAQGLAPKFYTIPEVRDAVHGARLTLRRRNGSAGGKHIAFYCGPSLEPWAPPVMDDGGIGGSETALMQIARRFAADGYTVDVFNDCGKWEGEHDGVCYWQHGRFPKADPYDLLVSWRQGRLSLDEDIGAKRLWLWAHDLHYGPDGLTAQSAPGFERILGVSQFHADYLRLVYDFLPGHPGLDFVPNGINLDRFAPNGKERQRHRVVWLSSPDRGLDVLCSLWPSVLRSVPDAELYVYYGFNNMERLAKNIPQYGQFLRDIRAVMDKPGIVERGRLGQAALAQELQEASVLAYPSSFLETFGIISVEAQAAGVAVLATAIGALPEVVGDAGILVGGHHRSDAYMHTFLGCLLALLLDDDTWRVYHERGVARAPQWTWDKSYEKWKQLVEAKA